MQEWQCCSLEAGAAAATAAAGVTALVLAHVAVAAGVRAVPAPVAGLAAPAGQRAELSMGINLSENTTAGLQLNQETPGSHPRLRDYRICRAQKKACQPWHNSQGKLQLT